VPAVQLVPQNEKSLVYKKGSNVHKKSSPRKHVCEEHNNQETTKTLSNVDQYVTLDSKIKCLSLAVLFLVTPPRKLNWKCIYMGDS